MYARHRTQDLVAVKDNSHGCTLLVKVSDVWMVALAAMLYLISDPGPAAGVCSAVAASH